MKNLKTIIFLFRILIYAKTFFVFPTQIYPWNISPSNILVKSESILKLADVLLLTEVDREFLAPELMNPGAGAVMDLERAVCYSLGKIFQRLEVEGPENDLLQKVVSERMVVADPG